MQILCIFEILTQSYKKQPLAHGHVSDLVSWDEPQRTLMLVIYKDQALAPFDFLIKGQKDLSVMQWLYVVPTLTPHREPKCAYDIFGWLYKILTYSSGNLVMHILPQVLIN